MVLGETDKVSISVSLGRAFWELGEAFRKSANFCFQPIAVKYKLPLNRNDTV